MARVSLGRHIERLRTEPGLKKNVTALTVLVLIAMVAGGWILASQRFTPPWSHKFTLNAEFGAAPGVAPGNGQEVRIAGVIVGQITGANIDSRGKADLQMQLNPGTKIYRNARLVLRPKSPLNEMYVEIAPGGPPAPVVHSGATLPESNTERPIQVDEVLASLNDSTRQALTALLSQSDVALADAPKRLPGGLDKLSLISAQLRPVAIELAKRRTYLSKLVTAASQIATAVGGDNNRLTSLAGNLDTTLGSMAHGSSQLRDSLGQLPDLATKLDRATAAVRRLSGQLDPTLRDVGNASGVLPRALRRLTGTAHALDKFRHTAQPALQVARPVLADLRPVSSDLRVATPRLHRTTARLDPVTAELVRYLPDVGAFMVNTRSVTSLRDANGGILRGLLEITPDTVPHGNITPSELKGLAK